MTIRSLTVLVGCAVLATLTALATAALAVPAAVAYQAVLADSTGLPVDGPATVTLEVFDAEKWSVQ